MTADVHEGIMSVVLRRKLLAIAVLVWMALIAFLDCLTMMSSFVSRVSDRTGVPIVAARDQFHKMMSAPLHAP